MQRPPPIAPYPPLTYGGGPYDTFFDRMNLQSFPIHGATHDVDFVFDPQLFMRMPQSALSPPLGYLEHDPSHEYAQSLLGAHDWTSVDMSPPNEPHPLRNTHVVAPPAEISSSDNSVCSGQPSNACFAQPMPTFRVTEQVDVFGPEFAETALSAPIIILENMLNHPRIQINNEVFQHKSLDKTHGNQSVNVLFQQLDAAGWDIKGQYWMRQTLAQYLAYMRRVEAQVDAFKFSVGKQVKSVLESPISIATDADREDLRCFLALSQEDHRSFPTSLQRAQLCWPEISCADFHRINKGVKPSGRVLKDLNARLDSLPAVQRLKQSSADGIVRMELGEGPWHVAAERHTFDGDSFVMISVGKIVLLYGPLGVSPDATLPFSLNALTLDAVMDELTYIWKNTTHFLHADGSSQKSHHKGRKFDSMVLFCSNLDIGAWKSELDLLSKRLPDWMWCNSPHDILGLLRQPVQGMNIPQIYLKVPGSWTGGHEENCRFRSVNCNHGPGSSEWYAIDAKYAALLRERVLAEEGVDIYKVEGNWMPEPSWLDRMGIPYMTGIQRAGDVVVLKGATLHWVRSLGCASHSSWNFGYLDREQLEHATARYTINDSITPPIQNLVPMKTITLDVCRYLLKAHGLQPSKAPWSTRLLRLRAQLTDTAVDRSTVEFLLSALVEMVVEDKLWREHISASQNYRSIAEPDGALVVYCQQEGCAKEITTAYFRCDSCEDDKPRCKQSESPTFLCMQCGLQHARTRPQHELLFLHKDSIDGILQDMNEFTVFAARYLPTAATLCADAMERSITRISLSIQQFNRGQRATVPVERGPAIARPHPTGKKRARPNFAAGDSEASQPAIRQRSSTRQPCISAPSKEVQPTSESMDGRADALSNILLPKIEEEMLVVPQVTPPAPMSNYLLEAANANTTALLSVLQALSNDCAHTTKQPIMAEAVKVALRLQAILKEC